MFSGWARACLGEPEAGLKEMEGALATQRQIGTTEDFPVYFDMLAEVLAMLDRRDEALAAIDQAFEAASSSGLAYWNPELHRRRAELLWQRAGTSSEEADASLARARELAEAQNARALELRIGMTALDMSREGTEQRAAARASLQRIYERFPEGFETADLVQARRLLNNGAA